ncbi:MAG: hypothetical protein K9J16_15905 [Melioribacteraceae bacterium]|nr:hypothetical protein [Melioribacteraceae bacterium]MCF8354811.1 hypothetical protein [Melioribacteraceae bacterium]MCF8394558.1 hypothetical protein [Melioribacteraceae bacterium]MCF8420217.1 hypothetical protein [Melioribacteraceae bacterium]
MIEQNKLNIVYEKLTQYARKEEMRNLLQGFYLLIILFSGMALLFSLIEFAGRFDGNIRLIMFVILLSVTAILAIIYIGFPLFRIVSFSPVQKIKAIADKIGRENSQINDELLNVLQLIEAGESDRYSNSLVKAAFEKLYERIKPFNFSDSIRFSSVTSYIKYFAFASPVILLLIIFVPALNNSAYRIINYDLSFTEPPKFTLNVYPGNASITKGDDFNIMVDVSGTELKQISLSTKSKEQAEFNNRTIFADSSGKFIYDLKSVKNPFEYFASAQKISSDKYTVDVIDRPIISNFTLKIKPPAYTGFPETVQKDNGNINSLLGSTVEIDLRSNKVLGNAKINFTDGDSVQFDVNGLNASVRFRVNGDTQYYISITDNENIKNENPITYTVKSLADEYPAIEMIRPNEDITLGNEDRVPLEVKVSDDYGFAKLVLNYRLSSSRYEAVQKEFTQQEISLSKRQLENVVFHLWDMSPMMLAADDVVSYYLEVFDNDNVSGPKSAKTKVFTVRIPTLDELFAQAEETQNKAGDDLNQTLEEAKKLSEELKQISNELKQDSKEITWEEKDKIEKAMDKFNKLQEKVEDIQKSLSEMQNEMEQNDLLSEETLSKYMELQKLMDEMGDDQLKQAFEKMQDMLSKLQRDQIQQNMEDMEINEEAFQKSIERTLNLLKRIQVDQKVDEIVKRTEELLTKQEELMNKTSEEDLNDPAKNEELQKRQEDISNELNDLKEQMEKLQDMMSEMDDMPHDEMQKMMDEFEKQNNQELSKEAMQQMMKKMKSEAMKNQQMLSQNMEQMKQMMMNMQSQMQQQNQMEVLTKMLKIINNMLTVSREQEELKNESEILSSSSQQFNEKAQNQFTLQEDLSKILQQMSQLSQKTFAITPEMGKALGEANSQMQQSISALQQRNGRQASSRQTQAMKSINEAATMMNSMLNQLMQGGGQGGGMMSMMQQLQQMAQQQMTLNQMTQMMQQGKMSQQQMAQIQRLAQEQQMIQKSLEQLNREAKHSGESKKLTSNLDKILDDMKEVVTNMQTEKLNDDLINKQERILSKLLDAQRSINERDFEERRESLTGEMFNRESPADLILSSEEGKNKLREELLKAIKEGYSKDYEELIRKYFEALQKKEISN